jgi:hypothetical protein
MTLMRRFPGPVRLLWPLLLLPAWSEGPARADGAPAPRPVRLLAAEEGRVRFVVEPGAPEVLPFGGSAPEERRLLLPGFPALGKPGAPALPARTVLVAIPEEAEASVAVTDVVTADLGRLMPSPAPTHRVFRGEDGIPYSRAEYVVDPALYEASRVDLGRLAEPGEPARLHRTRVLPVRLNPVFYEGREGRVVAARRFTVTVTWHPNRSGREAGGAGVGPRTGSLWKGIFRSTVVNPGQGSVWSRGSPGPSGSRAPSPVVGLEVRLEVGETGLHRVTGERLTGAGLPPGPLDRIAVYRKRFEEGTGTVVIDSVRAMIREDPGSTPGVFDGQDEVVFYGLRLRDDPATGDSLEAYSWYNVYWISYWDRPAPRMREVASQGGTIFLSPPSAGFPVRVHVEPDRVFWEETPVGSYDYYYANQFTVPAVSLPFEMLHVAQGAGVTLRCRMTGSHGADPLRTVEVLLDGASAGILVGDDVPVPNKNVVTFVTSPPRPAGDFVVGANNLRVRSNPQGSQLRTFVRWLEVEYKARYRAVNDQLAFTSGDADGDTLLKVEGFTRDDLDLFEISDPGAPEHLTGPDIWQDDGGGGFRLIFRDTVSASSPSRYQAVPPEEIPLIAPERLHLDEESDILGRAGPYRVIVVTHPLFRDQMLEWVRYRERQGQSVLMVQVQDVFDEFNGGVFSPRAIKRLARYGLWNWDTEVLLLVGDSSEDHKGVEEDSGVNFVPTFSYNEHVRDINEDEVVTSDKWYGLMDNDFRPDDSDYLFDLMVGRISAGSRTELAAFLAKLFKYERPEPGQTWRKRVLHLADDAYSWSTFPTSYVYNSTEEGFRQAEQELSTIVKNASTSALESVEFFLADWTDEYHLNRPGETSVTPFINDTRSDATYDLLSELDAGVLLWNLQAHANRYQIGHEFLFTTSNQYFPSIGDHNRLQNVDRPFVVFGMGCHVNDYAVHKEEGRTGEFRDSMGEHLLFLGRRGAVASYASTGFEYLGRNQVYSRIIWRNFFEKPPTYWNPEADSATTAERSHPAAWVLGEVLTRSEIEDVLASPGGPGDNRTISGSGEARRYHLLGDPLTLVDAGPPDIFVQVDGKDVVDGDELQSSSGADTVALWVRFQDETAIDSVAVLVDGEDITSTIDLEPTVDTTGTPARDYEGTFTHRLREPPYEVEFVAYQYPDTVSGAYLQESRLTLHVTLSLTLSVNGRQVPEGGLVAPRGTYVLRLTTPTRVPGDSLDLELNGAAVPFVATVSDPADSLTWELTHEGALRPGRNTFLVRAGGLEIGIDVLVDTQLRLSQVIAYPNPFSREADFVFDVSGVVEGGAVHIYTTTGRRVRTLPIPPLQPGNNVVHWDGRDERGDVLASGVYLYRIAVGGEYGNPREFGKIVKIAGSGR